MNHENNRIVMSKKLQDRQVDTPHPHLHERDPLTLTCFLFFIYQKFDLYQISWCAGSQGEYNCVLVGDKITIYNFFLQRNYVALHEPRLKNCNFICQLSIPRLKMIERDRHVGTHICWFDSIWIGSWRHRKKKQKWRKHWLQFISALIIDQSNNPPRK